MLALQLFTDPCNLFIRLRAVFAFRRRDEAFIFLGVEFLGQTFQPRLGRVEVRR